MEMICLGKFRLTTDILQTACKRAAHVRLMQTQYKFLMHKRSFDEAYVCLYDGKNMHCYIIFFIIPPSII